MTDEQVTKLIDIGFVFVVKARRPTGKRTKNNPQRRRHDNPYAMEESGNEDEHDDDSFEG